MELTTYTRNRKNSASTVTLLAAIWSLDFPRIYFVSRLPNAWNSWDRWARDCGSGTSELEARKI